jgi:hypothetical protein
MIPKPAPGLRHRWTALLTGFLILFGVIASFGMVSLLLEEHYKPLKTELAILEMKIYSLQNVQGEAGLAPDDYKRAGELEEKLRGVKSVEFQEIGERLLDFSLVPIFLIICLMTIQRMIRWLWMGKPRIVKN